MDRCRRLAQRLYNIENPVGPQPSTNRSQPSSAADPALAAIIIFLNRSDASLARRAKSLLSSFFFCARTDLFLGRLRAPPDGFNNPPDTRNRPGERFFCTSSPRPVFDRTGVTRETRVLPGMNGTRQQIECPRLRRVATDAKQRPGFQSARYPFDASLITDN